MRNVLHNWLALHRVPGIGPAKFQECLLAEPNLLNLPAWVIPDWQGVEQDLQWQQQPNCHIVTLRDARYPLLLKQIANPPPLLFVQGDVDLLKHHQIAIVGSRNPSPRAVTIAHDFAQNFASVGILITSGLALGIDTASHQGALSVSDGKTLAVLACGLDKIYPKTNKKLAATIIANGALISEFPTGAGPLAHNFPRRNRIISGLSLGVLVVEATVKSGALITAHFANEQGREVFAVPGALDNPRAKGCHQLIKQGAQLVESTTDVLTELSMLLNNSLIKPCTPLAPKGNICSDAQLSEACRAILSYIDGDITTVDEIILRSGRAAADIIGMLSQLELQGYVLATPGGYLRKLEYNS